MALLSMSRRTLIVQVLLWGMIIPGCVGVAWLLLRLPKSLVTAHGDVFYYRHTRGIDEFFLPKEIPPTTQLYSNALGLGKPLLDGVEYEQRPEFTYLGEHDNIRFYSVQVGDGGYRLAKNLTTGEIDAITHRW